MYAVVVNCSNYFNYCFALNNVSLSCSELHLLPLLALLFRSFALNNTTSTDTSALCDVTKSTHTPPQCW